MKMSLGDFLKHVEEEFAKKHLMLRIIAHPSSFNQLTEAMKSPCETWVSPEERATVDTEGELLRSILGLIGQHPQYDHATVFLRFFDDTYCESFRIGSAAKRTTE
ncbi:hypothetical protein [Prosthecobacter sp.]|uniref:hypothetical protein n=1 Tax=Prosthecobacter sp. TaxID=1965333 RepID=UPI003784B6BC